MFPKLVFTLFLSIRDNWKILKSQSFRYKWCKHYGIQAVGMSCKWGLSGIIICPVIVMCWFSFCSQLPSKSIFVEIIYTVYICVYIYIYLMDNWLRQTYQFVLEQNPLKSTEYHLISGCRVDKKFLFFHSQQSCLCITPSFCRNIQLCILRQTDTAQFYAWKDQMMSAGVGSEYKGMYEYHSQCNFIS